MLRFVAWALTVTIASWLSGCSGKTEHGAGAAGGDAAPVQQPATGPANVGPPKAGPAKHLVMIVELEPAAHAARTLMSRSVELPLPHRRGPAPQEPWRVDVLDSGGAVLYSAPLPDAGTLRAEFPDQNGQLKGVTAQQRVTAVTLRLPWLRAASEVRIVSVGQGGDSELGRVVYPQVEP
jgi:hypothetical protein